MEVQKTAVADAMALMMHEIKGDLFELGDIVSDNEEAVRRIDDIARRAERIVSFYQIASGEGFFCMAPVYVADLVHEAVMRVGRKKGVALTVLHGGDDHLWLMSRDLVGDMLANGIRNALRYAKARVEVMTGVDENGALLIAIHDDGPGFSEQVLNDGPLALGSGLFIADRVMRLHARDGDAGQMLMENGGALGGASLVLRFPVSMNGDC